jgi:hypothetical protein
LNEIHITKEKNMTRFLVSLTKNKETKKLAKGVRKRNKQNQLWHAEIIYLVQPESWKQLTTKLEAHDVLEIYAEGTSMFITPTFSHSTHEFTATTLALKIADIVGEQKKHLPFVIDLRTCNSGTLVTENKRTFCFAQDLSRALSDNGLIHVVVKGYTGFILTKRLFRNSVGARYGQFGSKIGHCKLEDA